MPELDNSIEEEYGRQMDRIQRKLWAYEGEGPPGDGELTHEIKHQTEGAIYRIMQMAEHRDMDRGTLQTLNGVLGKTLEVLVAVEMLTGERGNPFDEEPGDGSEQAHL